MSDRRATDDNARLVGVDAENERIDELRSKSDRIAVAENSRKRRREAREEERDKRRKRRSQTGRQTGHVLEALNRVRKAICSGHSFNTLTMVHVFCVYSHRVESRGCY